MRSGLELLRPRPDVSDSYFETFHIIRFCIDIMSYTILPASTADLSEIVTIYNAAFKEDRIIGNLMAAVPLEVKKAYDIAWYRREFDMSKLNGLRFYKAVDQHGKMVGYAKWQYPYTLTPDQEEEKRRLDNAKNDILPLPKGTNTELYREFFEPLHEKQRRYAQKETIYCESVGPLAFTHRSGLLWPFAL